MGPMRKPTAPELAFLAMMGSNAPASPANAQNAQAAACGPVPPVTLQTQGRYVGGRADPSHSQVDEEQDATYRAAMQPVRDYLQCVVQQTNRYLRSQRPADAQAALAMLAQAAQAGSLTQMQSQQGWLSQGQTVSGLALAYLQIRQAPALAPDQKAQVENWLANLAEGLRGFMDANPGRDFTRNNHRYWAGLAATASGIATNRPALVDWGIESARVGLRQVRSDGTLPLEMARGSRTRDYYILAVAPLTKIAELALATNRADLYRELNGALPRLAYTAGASLMGQGPLGALPGQEPLPAGNSLASRMAWLHGYQRQQNDLRLGDVMRRLSRFNATALGGDQTLATGMGLPLGRSSPGR